MRLVVICALCVLAVGCATTTHNRGTQGKSVSDSSSSEPAQLSMQEDCTLPLEERIQIRVDTYKAAGKIPPPIYVNRCPKQGEPGGRAPIGSEQKEDYMTIFRGNRL
jgi:hypothetical protein